MDTLIHADIFFFITSIAVIVLTAALVVVLIYLAQFLRNARDISRTGKKESEDIAADISTLRVRAKQEGLKWRFFTDFFSKFFRRYGKRRSRK